jgi:hypothetical protein
MALTRGVVEIDSPEITLAPTVLDVVPVATVADSHQLMGVQYEAEGFYPASPVALNADDCIASAEKTADGLQFVDGEDPFHVYSAVACGLFPAGTDYQAKSNERLLRGEGYLVERHLWEDIFRERAVDLTPAAGAVSVVVGLGILEEYAGKNYSGVPIVHSGRRGAVALQAKNLIEDGETKTGSLFVNGGGYFSTEGPDVVTPPIASPVAALGATTASGGTFAAGDYFWVVTATNAHGETLASNEVTATLVANDSKAITWDAITGATGYKLYRGTAAGAEDVLVATVGAVTTATDTGDAGEAATLPATNTTGFATPTPAGDGNVWLYVTGVITLLRGAVESHTANKVQSNDTFALSERTYIPLVDGIVGAIRITLE